MTPPDLSPVGGLARAGDEARFLAALFAPVAARERLFALIAFNCELAKIAVSVSEPMLGEIRLQWWLDALDDLFDRGAVRGHEAMAALAATRADAGWDRATLTAMVEARRLSLGGVEPDRDTLSRFLADTGGAYQRLAVGSLGGDAAACEVAGLVGWAEGAGRLVAAIPDIAPTAKEREALRGVAQGLAAEARAKLAAARRRRRETPRRVRAPLLSAHFAEPALYSLEDPPRKQVLKRTGGRGIGFSLLWRGMAGRF